MTQTQHASGELELCKVNLLEVKVVYDAQSKIFTIKPSRGDMTMSELERHAVEPVDFETTAMIQLDRILAYFGIHAIEVIMTPVTTDPNKAEFAFTIEEDTCMDITL